VALISKTSKRIGRVAPTSAGTLAFLLLGTTLCAQSATQTVPDYQVRVRGYVQADGRFYPSGALGTPSTTFLLRRVRPIFEATAFDRFQARIMPDFGEGKVVLQDAYVDAILKPLLKVRVGKFKSPFGLERLVSATEILFIERAAPTSLAPNRDVGIMLHGQSARERLSYGIAFVNGVADGGSGDVDTRNGNDLVGRLFVKPFGGSAPAALRGLAVGGAIDAGRDTGTVADSGVSAYRTAGQQVFFKYRSDGTAAGTVTTDGDRLRTSLQATWYTGSVGAVFERTWSSQQLRIDGHSDRLVNSAWMLTTEVVLTGEPASPRGVVLSSTAGPRARRTGAVELVARLSNLDVDDAAYPLFANRSASARSAFEWALGANWHVNRAVKIATSFHSTSFEGGDPNGNRPSERLILSRLQFAF